MKKILLLTVFALCIGAASAQEKAKVFIYRSTGFAGSAAKAKINIDKQTCKIGNNNFMEIKLDADTYFFSTHKGHKPVKIELEAGKIYYFDLRIETGFWSGHYVISEITERAANQYLENPKMEEVPDCF